MKVWLLEYRPLECLLSGNDDRLLTARSGHSNAARDAQESRLCRGALPLPLLAEYRFWDKRRNNLRSVNRLTDSEVHCHAGY